MKTSFKFQIIFLLLLVFVPSSVFAGTISDVYKYAWANNAGWVNFNPTNGNVAVSDTALTGYIWNEVYGWINLNPAGSGVANTTSGTLSGYAWGENAGWVNFSGVTINCSGQFTGTATGDMVGTINFDCSNCVVKTSWTPSSGCGGGGSGGGGGGILTYHNECNSQKQCVSVSGAGIDQCQTASDCASHNECNAKLQCVSVPGVGSNQCSSNSDCNTTHGECGGDIVCRYNACTSSQCLQVTGLGINQCLTNSDCGGGRHNQCLGQRCVLVDGTGINSCQTDSDCLTSHKECSNNQCLPVPGVGIDQCNNDSDCKLAKHNECDAQKKCVSVNGGGPDFCQTNLDCAVTHRECSNLQCVPVAGVGINQCSNDTDCKLGGHNECNTQKQCVSVSGDGTNQCQTSSDCIGQPLNEGEKHNECNTQKQCVSVSGAGMDQCNTNDDCTGIIVKIIQKPAEAIQSAVKQGIKQIETAVGEIKKIIESPAGSIISKAISTTGVVVATAEIATAAVLSPLEIFWVLLRSLGIFLTAVGIKKRVKPWGVVYDSATKQPLDPVFVTLKDSQGKTISSAITDLDGRYGFLVEKPGVYYISARKTNYIFPSQKLAGRINDELYDGLYFGEALEIKQWADVIIKNIPMDSLRFDWNEFVKSDKKLMKFYSKIDVAMRMVFDWFFGVGFAVAVTAYFVAPYPYNFVILIIYLVLLFLKFINIKPKAYGRILDTLNGDPLSFAVLKVMIPGLNVEITSKVADKYGRYYCLIPPGKYYVKIEKKNDDGLYSLVYTSPVFDLSKKGIIKRIFRI